MENKTFLFITFSFLVFNFLNINNANAQLLTCGGGATEADCVAAGGQVETVSGCTLCKILKGSYTNASNACVSVGMLPRGTWAYYSGSSCPSNCSIAAGWSATQPSCTYVSSTKSYFDVWMGITGCCSDSGCVGTECYSDCAASAYYWGNGNYYPLAYCFTYDQSNWWLRGYICPVYATQCFYDLGYPTILCPGVVEAYGCIGSNVNAIPTAVIDLPSTSNHTIDIGDSINFSGHGTDTDGVIAGYNWRLGTCDGTVLSSNQTFSYTFNSSGTYTIYFLTIDDDGAFSTNCPYITINVTSPPPSFCVECNETNKSNVCEGKTFESCSGPCEGTKECNSSWQEVLP